MLLTMLVGRVQRKNLAALAWSDYKTLALTDGQNTQPAASLTCSCKLGRGPKEKGEKGGPFPPVILSYWNTCFHLTSLTCTGFGDCKHTSDQRNWFLCISLRISKGALCMILPVIVYLLDTDLYIYNPKNILRLNSRIPLFHNAFPLCSLVLPAPPSLHPSLNTNGIFLFNLTRNE